MQNIKLKEKNQNIIAIPAICALAYFAVIFMAKGNTIPLLVMISFILIFLAGIYDNNYLFYSMIMLMPFTRLQVPYFPLSLYLSLLVAFTGLSILILKRHDFPKTQINMAIIIYTTVMFISIIRTYIFADLEPPGTLDSSFGIQASRHRGWYHLATQLSMLFIFFFTVWSSRSMEHFKKTIRIFCGVTIAVVLFGYYEFAAKILQLPLMTISTNIESVRYVSQASFELGGISFPRVYGTFIEPSDYANFLLIGFSISLSLVLWNFKQGKANKKAILMFGCIASGIILTISTAGWVCAMIIFFILTYVYGFKQLISTVLIISMVIWLSTCIFGDYNISEIGYDAFSIHFQKLIDFIFGYNEASFRTIGRKIFWNIFRQYPVLGVGLGNEVFYSGYYENIMGCSNHYLTIIAETGLIGLAAFVYLISHIYIALFHTIKSVRNNIFSEAYPYLYAFIAALTGTLVFHLYGYGRFFMHEWFLIGMCFCLYNITQNRKENRA